MYIAYVRGICMMSRFWSTHLFSKFRIFEFSKNGDFDMKSRPFLARVFPEFSYIVAALKKRSNLEGIGALCDKYGALLLC